MTETHAVGLTLESVDFSWPDATPLFSGLDLRFPQGSITALVGKSGCGKSTVLRIGSGLLPAQSGAVSGGGQGCSLVFQSPNLLAWRTVWENVALPLELGGALKREDVDEAIEQVGLTDVAHRLPAAISGGQRMRAALARSLVTRPKLMLLDEPFAALDAITRRHIQQEFLALWRNTGFTAVLVTHDIDEAVLLSDSVIVLGGDPVVASEPVSIHLPRPRSPALRHHPETGELVARIEAML